MHKVKRNEIYLADLRNSLGSEQAFIRPVLVIQNNRGNKYSPTTIVACISSKVKEKNRLPTHYFLPKDVGLKTDSIVILEQIKTIDQKRLIKYIGKVSKRMMYSINKRILISFDLTNKERRGDYV